jgi:hypothetical protein
MDTELLRRIDADPEARERGRSAFIRSAVEMYLRARRRREIDVQITDAYADSADDLLKEVADLLGGQEGVPQRQLKGFVGTLGPDKMREVCRALAIATGCESDP